MRKIILGLTTMALLTQPVLAQQASLEDRVSELEAQNTLNIFSFSGTLNTRFDNAKVTQEDPSSIEYKDLNYWRTRFSLNVDANVNPYIKVYSRYTMTKMFNSWRQQGTASATGSDLRASDNYLSSGVFVEKAYADMQIPETGLIFSVGRLPTTDGQPANYWDGKARMGTYPLMAYGSILDGMALTYKLDQYMPADNSLSLRFLYTPFTSFTIANLQLPPTTDSTSTNAAVTGGDKAKTTMDFYTGQIDYTVNNLSFANSINVIVQHYFFKNLEFASNIATNNANSSTLAIDVKSTSFAVDINDIMASGVDFSVSQLMTSVESNGTNAAFGNKGYGVNDAEGTTTASTTLASLRYKMNSWIFGAEYLKGQEGIFYTGNTAEDLNNFYGTPGTATHAYFTKKFVDNLSLRIGMYNQDEKYTRLSAGEPTETDKKIETYYANLRLDF